MGINVKGMLGGAARVAAGAALLVAAGSAFAPAHAAKLKTLINATPGTGEGQGPLLSTYFALGGYGGNDDLVVLDNPTSATECAMIYVFDSNEELQESCAAPVSANGQLTFDVLYDLAYNPAFPPFYGDEINGVIEIISAEPNDTAAPFASGDCDPNGTITPITAIDAYLDTSVTVEYYDTPLTSATVLPFTNDGTVDTTNISTLQGYLKTFAADGSGRGVCNTDPSWS